MICYSFSTSTCVSRDSCRMLEWTVVWTGSPAERSTYSYYG